MTERTPTEDICTICLEGGKLHMYVFSCRCRLPMHATCLEQWDALNKDICPLCKRNWSVQNVVPRPPPPRTPPPTAHVQPPLQYRISPETGAADTRTIVVIQGPLTPGQQEGQDACCACCFCFCCIGLLLLFIFAGLRYIH